MTDRRMWLVALAVWAGVLLALSLAGMLTLFTIDGITSNGFLDDGSDPGMRDRVVTLFTASDTVRTLMPELSTAALVSVASVFGVLAVRWQRREAAGSQDQAPATAES